MQQMLVLLYLYGLLYEQSLVTNIASIREYRRRRRNQHQHPYYWTLPRPNEPWFEIHYYDPTIPDDFFRQQLRMRRTTFQILLNVITPRITRLDTRFRNCVPPEKVLALGLFRLAHGNSYISIAPAMNVGKSTLVIEAVQDVVESLFDYIKYIKFLETENETTALKFAHLRSIPISRILSALLTGTHIRIEAPKESAVDYFSRYQQHDFVVQAVVDARTIFIGWPPNEPKNWRSSIFGALLPGLSHANVNCSFTVNWQLFDISNGFCWFQPIFKNLSCPTHTLRRL